MTEEVRPAPVRGTSREDFLSDAEAFRPELLAHCYRMVGSVHDAEDLVQDTYLRAWRGYDQFRGSSSVRTWLYRIATNVCLTALERNTRRPLPSGLGHANVDTPLALAPSRPELPWLEPIPDASVIPASADPAAVVAIRLSVRLALVAALQHLPARQRAVLLLRDVLSWRAAEVAELLDTTTAAVNSTLQRARAQLAHVSPAADDTAEPTGPGDQLLLRRYVDALQNADVGALLALLEEDVTLEMPPFPSWFSGRASVLDFYRERVLTTPGRLRLVPLGANGQPAFAAYGRDADGALAAHSIQVLTIGSGRIQRIVSFLDKPLFALFGLPLCLDDEGLSM